MHTNKLHNPLAYIIYASSGAVGLDKSAQNQRVIYPSNGAVCVCIIKLMRYSGNVMWLCHIACISLDVLQIHIYQIHSVTYRSICVRLDGTKN